MKIIITAVGQGSRFTNIGISKPKYKIIANDKSLFYWSINSLRRFFDYKFIFIFRKTLYDKKFVMEEIQKLGIRNYSIILVDYLTEGQASTAMFADKYMDDDESFMIYNIDTMIYPESMNEEIIKNCDGTIVVAKALGEHWSFAKLGDDGFVSNVSEKIKISDYASVGPYYFKYWKDFKWVFNNFKDDIKKQYKEVYVCPMYQYLIDQKKKKIKIFEIKNTDFVCLGTPKEVEEFDSNWLKRNL